MGFEADLKFGSQGEEWIYIKNREYIEKLPGIVGDLKIKSTNKLIEVKTDRKKSTDSGNIFFERYSNRGRKTNGGPWQALDHKCSFFCVLFWADKKEFWFDINKLVSFLNSSNYSLIDIKSSNASGYIVPIKDIKSLLLDLAVDILST